MKPSFILFRHRFIVLRRIFLLVGVLYLYRSVTMWVTALPIADTEYVCAEKVGVENLTASIVADR